MKFILLSFFLVGSVFAADLDAKYCKELEQNFNQRMDTFNKDNEETIARMFRKFVSIKTGAVGVGTVLTGTGIDIIGGELFARSYMSKFGYSPAQMAKFRKLSEHFIKRGEFVTGVGFKILRFSLYVLAADIISEAFTSYTTPVHTDLKKNPLKLLDPELLNGGKAGLCGAREYHRAEMDDIEDKFFREDLPDFLSAKEKDLDRQIAFLKKAKNTTKTELEEQLKNSLQHLQQDNLKNCYY